MKLKNILENIISEGASDILYYFMFSQYVLDMLQKNKYGCCNRQGFRL